MKALMTGVHIPNMLSIRTYMGKVIGITAMMCSGMSVGKDGPFVHIAGCIANMRPNHENSTLRH